MLFILTFCLSFLLPRALATVESCDAFLGRDITFDEFYPPDGRDPGPSRFFVQATQEVIHVLGELQSGVAPFDFERERPLVPIGPDHDLAYDLGQALDDQHPSVRGLMITVSGLDELYPGWPGRGSFVTLEPPLHVLPGEWQRDLIDRVRATPPPFTTTAMLDRLATVSQFTERRFHASDSVQGARPIYEPGRRLRELNPRDGGLSYSLDAVIEHYFPAGVSLDEAALRRVLNAHVTFWVANPAGTRAN